MTAVLDDEAGREERLRSYLLGALPAAEQDAIDESFLGDEALHEELLAAQDDLIHAYLAGQLPAADRERFESHFLASPRRRERMAFIRSLTAAIDRTAGRAMKARQAADWSRALPWAAVLAVGLAGGGWSLRERQRFEEGQARARAQEAVLDQRVAEQGRRIAELEAQLTAGPAGTDVATWRLQTGLERGSSPVPARSPASGWVRLRVTLDHGLSAPSYQASLQTAEGRELLLVHALRSAPGPEGPTVEVMAPAQALGIGTYVLSIRPDRPGPQPEVAVATFSVR